MITITHKNPGSQLSKYVRKISTFESKRDLDYKHKLTPSAFTYLSYNHNHIPVSIFNNKRLRPNNRLQIAGPKINDDIFVEYNGKLFQILVEFTASGFYYLFHHSPWRIKNNLSNLSDYISTERSILLEQDLCDSKNSTHQVKLLEEFLIERLPVALPFVDYIENALNLIEQHNGSIQIHELIKEVGISERQFNRKFREIVGLSPKAYSKILQLHYVIRLMQSKEYSSIQDLAYRAEYYDLAHFAHRFKELTGFSPNAFINSDKHIALKYFTDPQP